MVGTTYIAILLRPIAYAIVFFFVLAPIIWVLNRLIPPGRVKTALFKVRSGALATKRDKVVMTLAVIGAYALLIGWVTYLSWGKP